MTNPAKPARAGTEAIERDARIAHADRAHVAPSEIAIGVIIGRVSEFFDFFVFGLAAVLVFPRVFFPFTTQLDGTLYAFARSEEHTSELQSLMRISYAVFCLKKKIYIIRKTQIYTT